MFPVIMFFSLLGFILLLLLDAVIAGCKSLMVIYLSIAVEKILYKFPAFLDFENFWFVQLAVIIVMPNAKG